MSTAGCNSPSRRCFPLFRPVLNQAYNPGLIVWRLRAVSLIHTFMVFFYLFFAIKVQIAVDVLQGRNRNERLEHGHRALRLCFKLYKRTFLARRINLLRNFLKRSFFPRNSFYFLSRSCKPTDPTYNPYYYHHSYFFLFVMGRIKAA